MRLPSAPFVSTVFNTDLCIVELVGADNRPVTPGAPSAKVLVTNLYNVTQPLIRYEPTDTFTASPMPPSTAICGPAYKGATTKCGTRTPPTSIGQQR